MTASFPGDRRLPAAEPQIKRVIVNFRAYHDSALPEALTRALGIEPTRTVAKGDIIDTAGDSHAPKSGWFLSSTTARDSVNPLDHVLAAVSPLLAVKRAWLEAAEAGWEGDVLGFIFCRTGASVSLSQEALDALVALRLPVGMIVMAEGSESAAG